MTPGTLHPTSFLGSEGNSLATDAQGPADGPVVVLLHGGGQTRHSWTGLQSLLADSGYYVIAYDARGHGESQWSRNGDYRFDAFADDLTAISSAIGRPLALVGASLGGLAAMIAVTRQPPLRCWALALVDVVPRLNLAGRNRVLEFMSGHAHGFASTEDAERAIAAYLPHRKAQSGRPGLMKNLRQRGGRYFWHWDPAFMISRSIDGALDEVEAMLQHSDFPILLLRGELSDVVREVEAQAFARAVPRAKTMTIPDAAHMVASDRNDIFGQAILEFLNRSRASDHDATGLTI